MKLLVVVPTLGRGGAERVVSLLTHEWEKENDVVVVVLDTGNQFYPVGGRLLHLNSPASDSLWKQTSRVWSRERMLARILDAEQPDRVISFLEPANIPTAIACYRRGFAGVLTTSVRNNPRALPWYYRVIIRHLYPLGAEVVAVSQGVADALAVAGSALHRKLRAIPNPVDLQLIERHASESPPEDPVFKQPYILAVGRLAHQKGYDRLIEAYAAGATSHAVNLVIAGDGTERPRLEALAERLAVRGRVFLPGAFQNPFALMARAEAYVLSSRWEGWPNAMVEALACGCPVIAFDCPFGPREILQHDVTGLLVPDGDTSALAAAIHQLLGDEALQRRLAKNGKESVRAFDVQKIAKHWLGIES